MAQTFTSTDVVSTTNVFADNQSQRVNENTLRSNFSGTSQPSDPVIGQQWYDTTNSKTWVYNGSAWVANDTNSATQLDVSNSKGSLASLTSYLRVAHNDDGTLKTTPASSIDEFKDNSLVITYVSATSFRVPSDLTSIFTANRKLKIYLSASTVVTYVSSSTYDSTNSWTVVTIGGSVLDSSVTAVKYSIVQYGEREDTLHTSDMSGYATTTQLSSYAPLASPALAGTPTTPTPAQFDTSTQIANGASVMAAAGAVRGVLSISANHTLTAADNGKAIITTTGGITIGTPTLPFPNAHFTIMNNASTAILFVSTLGTNIIYGEFGWGLSSISIPAYSTLDLYCDGTSWITKSLSKYSASITGSYPGYRVIDPVTRLMVQFGITGVVSTGATLTTSFPVSFNAIAYPPIITAYNGGTISLDGDNGPLIVTNWLLSSFTVKSTDDANAYSCNYIVFGI